MAVLACLLAAESGLSWAKVGIEGSATQKLRVRTTGAMDDFDMETLLTASLFPENSSKWSGFVQMGEIYDLDSDSPDSPFGSVYDTFDNRAAFRLYSAYFDLKNTGFVANLRAGRQHRHEFESLYFDGMELKTKPASGFSVAAYAGVPVHLYENQFGLDSGDWLAGGALQWNPNGEFQARVDYVHLKDEWTGFRAAAGDLEDNLIGASFWWEVTRRISWEGKFTSFFDKVRDVSSKIAYNWSEKDFSVAVQFYRLLEGYGIRVTDWDAYGFLGNYQPYT
ncbi:MAG: hypothetical protein Q7T11_00485, partial [Deltaproteobacteria bacterium]|nr:hypothetical protein [Deltaproteobacteria bacterium]